MRVKLIVMLVLALIVVAGFGVAPASAGNFTAVCSANPMSGPPGTTFTISCSGFAPNELLNTYMVEPDGRAIAGAESSMGVFTDPANPRADSGGVVAYSFITKYDAAAAQVGDWTLVVTEPNNGTAGKVTVTVTGTTKTFTGAMLTVNPASGRSFTFLGSGFAPFEVVNVWLTMPQSCSGTSGSYWTDSPDNDRSALSAVNPSYWNTSLGWNYPGENPKTDAAGNFAFSITFRSYACTGEYHFTARALGSGLGADVTFIVVGKLSVPAGGASISVTNVPHALHARATVIGTGFPGGVTCWGTRPDGRAIAFGSVATDAAGSFALTSYIEDVDPNERREAFSESAEPGMWYMTCSTPDHSALAITTFMVGGAMLDP